MARQPWGWSGCGDAELAAWGGSSPDRRRPSKTPHPTAPSSTTALRPTDLSPANSSPNCSQLSNDPSPNRPQPGNTPRPTAPLSLATTLRPACPHGVFSAVGRSSRPSRRTRRALPTSVRATLTESDSLGVALTDLHQAEPRSPARQPVLRIALASAATATSPQTTLQKWPQRHIGCVPRTQCGVRCVRRTQCRIGAPKRTGEEQGASADQVPASPSITRRISAARLARNQARPTAQRHFRPQANVRVSRRPAAPCTQANRAASAAAQSSAQSRPALKRTGPDQRPLSGVPALRRKSSPVPRPAAPCTQENRSRSTAAQQRPRPQANRSASAAAHSSAQSRGGSASSCPGSSQSYHSA